MLYLGVWVPPGISLGEIAREGCHHHDDVVEGQAAGEVASHKGPRGLHRAYGSNDRRPVTRLWGARHSHGRNSSAERGARCWKTRSARGKLQSASAAGAYPSPSPPTPELPGGSGVGGWR